jgi:hypothetical protein
MAKFQILCGPIPNKYLGFGRKGLVFSVEIMDKRLKVCTKMGGDKLAKNTQNDLKIFGPICLPKLKNSGFLKALSGCP